jgi:predicted ribosome quality control (RQC) complex YloA/Tae2 family protein
MWDDLARRQSRLQIWNKKLSHVAQRLRSVSVQKISASEDGLLILSVYKPGDDRTSVVFNIKKNQCNIECTAQKPIPSQKPNSFVQIARKYLLGRKVKDINFSLSPIAFMIVFEENQELAPNCLLLDFEEARVCVAIKINESVPKRYQNVAEKFLEFKSYFESVGEWSLEGTKTKRRITFSEGLVECCFLPPNKNDEELQASATEHGLENATQPVTQSALDSVQVVENKPMNLNLALELMPTHFRRSVKTKLQFFQRRILKQKADMPGLGEKELLKKRCLGLQTHLYLWPQGFNMWHVPPHLIEEFSLPAVITLAKGETPGEYMEGLFENLNKIEKRESQLRSRIVESEQAALNFETLILQAGEEILRVFSEIDATNPTISEKKTRSYWELNKKFSKNFPHSVARLELITETKFFATEHKQQIKDLEKTKRLPYRIFKASTGEFLRVSKSAQDADDMFRLIPSHHTWVHVMTGEGSHVWVEKPKKLSQPSNAALREAALLAVHHSKLGRGMEGEVYVAKRSDVEKKKDLAIGKVIVKRSTSLFVKYSENEIKIVLQTGQKN